LVALLIAPATSVAATTGEQLTVMPVTEPFDGSTESLSNFASKWSNLSWATGSTPKGSDTTTGWRAVDPFVNGPNGAYYNPSLSDTGLGIAAVATMAANPASLERYFSVWLDMQSAGSTRAGYELRFTETATNIYEVKLLKWSGGSETVLASKSGYSFLNGNSFAIVDQGDSVSAWTDTGSGFTSLLSASDSAYSGGNSGIEARGNFTRLNKFKTGSLPDTGAQLTAMPVTEPFDGSTESHNNFNSKWSKLGWAVGEHPRGEDTTSGWRSSLSSAKGWTGPFYNPSISDVGPGIAAVATMARNPESLADHFSIWLDLQNPGGITKAGYELRVTDTAPNTAPSTFEVKLLKWTAGSEAVLASKSEYSFPDGTSFGIVDRGSSVSAWADTGSGFSLLLSASDSAYSGGNVGIEAKGNITRLTNFKVGSLQNIGAQLTAMPVTEPFDGSTESLSNFASKWSNLSWATGSTPKGEDTTTGWRAHDIFNVGANGAYYTPSITDTGSGIAAVATMANSPEALERYFSIWLDMLSPGSTRAGYELRFTEDLDIEGTYEVKLVKWTGGSEAVLASKSGYSFLNGNSFAIVDQGDSVSAWTDTGSGFTSLLSASDSAYSGGNSGIEARGNFTRLNKFKTGSL
jgi:hypothetical protein